QSPAHHSLFFHCYRTPRALHSFPTRRSSDLIKLSHAYGRILNLLVLLACLLLLGMTIMIGVDVLLRNLFAGGIAASNELSEDIRSEEHTSELQSLRHLVCRLLLEKKKKINHL